MLLRFVLLVVLLAALACLNSFVQAQSQKGGKDPDPFMSIMKDLTELQASTKKTIPAHRQKEVDDLVVRMTKDLATMQKVVKVKNIDLPDGFRTSLKDSSDALKLAAEVNLKPDQRLVVFAGVVDDITAKTEYANSTAMNVFSAVKVTVRTLDGVLEKKGCRVFYVPVAWVNDLKKHSEFANDSSPTTEEMWPGRYYMWTKLENRLGDKKVVVIGTNGKLEQSLDLPIPLAR